MTTLHQKKSGFTLIELLVVSTIIMVLAAIGMVSFSAAGKTARDGKRKSDMETVRQALVLYRQQNTAYPSGTYASVAGGLGSTGYLSLPIPADPSVNTYTYTQPNGTAGFCVCALMENPAKGNSTSTNCTYSVNQAYYCASN